MSERIWQADKWLSDSACGQCSWQSRVPELLGHDSVTVVWPGSGHTHETENRAPGVAEKRSPGVAENRALGVAENRAFGVAENFAFEVAENQACGVAS